MKKWLLAFICALALLAPIEGKAVTTTKYALSSTTWTDLGVGPIIMSATGSIVYAIADTTPAIPLNEGLKILSGGSIVINTTSHVWAMNQGSSGASVYVAPILASSGGSGGGGITSITAGTTPTSGFTANQLMVSDGTKTIGATSASGGMNTIQFGSATGPVMYGESAGIDFSKDVTGFYNYGGVRLNASTGDITTAGAYGFTLNGYLSTNSDISMTRFGPSIAGFFNKSNFTTPTSLRVYNTYTDTSNGEWGGFDWQTTPNTLYVGTAKNGTGTARNAVLGSNAYSNFTATPDGYSHVWGPLAFDYQTIITVGNGYLTVSGWGVDTPSFWGSQVLIKGTQPTITGAGGTCAATTKVGGATAGTVVLSGICATTNTIAFTGMPGSTNGYACDAQDRTTRTALFVESASTTTSFTLTTGATSSVAGDVLQWKCIGY